MTTLSSVPTLEYDSTNTLDLDVQAFALAMHSLMYVAILSGCCVLSCFLMAWARLFPLVVVVHVFVYGAILWMAYRAGRYMDQLREPDLSSPTRQGMDLLAGAGLVILGLAPLGLVAIGNPSDLIAGTIGGAFAIMAGTTFRHFLLYRGLGRVFSRAGHPRLARSLSTLGIIKTVFEGIWLTCCALPLIFGATRVQIAGMGFVMLCAAVGALLGCVGFGIIWIYMIVVHARAAAIASQLRAREPVPAFEVVPSLPVQPRHQIEVAACHKPSPEGATSV